MGDFDNKHVPRGELVYPSDLYEPFIENKARLESGDPSTFQSAMC